MIRAQLSGWTLKAQGRSHGIGVLAQPFVALDSPSFGFVNRDAEMVVPTAYEPRFRKAQAGQVLVLCAGVSSGNGLKRCYPRSGWCLDRSSGFAR